MSKTETKACKMCGVVFHRTRNMHWDRRMFCSNVCRFKSRQGVNRDTHWIVTHGKSKTPEHYVWRAMRQRCLNPKCKAYRTYGARGITICERWMSFANFIADMGKRPDGGTLERIDNNGPYSPSNCKWASRTEQQRNIRTNRILTHGGRSMPVRAWEQELGFKRGIVGFRLRLGWTVDQALLTPAIPGNKPHHRVSS